MYRIRQILKRLQLRYDVWSSISDEITQGGLIRKKRVYVWVVGDLWGYHGYHLRVGLNKVGKNSVMRWKRISTIT